MSRAGMNRSELSRSEAVSLLGKLHLPMSNLHNIIVIYVRNFMRKHSTQFFVLQLVCGGFTKGHLKVMLA